ncbi:DUF4399 domain-containing protein [Litoreibacter roseus]|uniref:Rod shape-determining protein RodA n=1 Tax=Litoreibacter roseus TaxID=2601869 RepID=A0A6N6JIR6_9RHOB|nr:DUF4399 domain-containing protein [Litoreibacter roseus]GFE65975.1 rod shape-determining protein RodA [Litoreibacter roseus]
MRSLLFAATFACFAPISAIAGDTPAPADAEVYFVNLEDGATVTSPFKVIFGLSGMGVAPAGTEKENTGHHHLLINRPPLGEGEEGETEYGLPADDNHVHFGGGQTETMLELPPGEHTLQLVMGDLNHVPHIEPVTSDVITITVEE